MLNWALYSMLLLGPAAPSHPSVKMDLHVEGKELTYVGFQKLLTGARVFVKTNEKAIYEIENPDATRVLLVLSNTRVPLLNNTRSLDTRYFNSPVTRVDIGTRESPAPQVRIEITVPDGTKPVPLQQDDLLALDFLK